MIIGLTGGIGSGKSTIAHELAQRGYAVYDCDREAKRIIAEDAKVQAAIIDLLGEEAFEGGRYNTSFVARRVFSAPELLAALNAIVHPVVKEDILQRKPAFVESAILYESGLDALCDKIVYVDAPIELRVARTVARDHTAPEQVLARIQAQQTQPHKNTIVLSNDGTLSIPQLTDLLLNLTGL